MHICEAELLLAFIGHVLCILLAEEVPQFTLLAPFTIFLGSHQQGGVQIAVANLRADDIHTRGVIILHLLTDILRQMQVNSRRVQVGHLHRSRLLNLPSGV